MTNAIYITTTEPYSGKSVVALGLMNLLVSRAERIAYFKPIISSDQPEKDSHLHTISSHFKLATPYENVFVFTRKDLVKMLSSVKETFVIDSIISKCKQLQDSHDFVVVEGTDFSSITNEEFDMNIS